MPIHYGKINGIDDKSKVKEIEVLYLKGMNYSIYFTEIKKIKGTDDLLVLYKGHLTTSLNKKVFEIQNLDDYTNSVKEVEVGTDSYPVQSLT